MTTHASADCFLTATRVDAGAALELDAASAPLGIVGVPYDGAVTYRGGASEGPREIRLASDSIESYDPWFDADLEEGPLFDFGDLEIPSEGGGEQKMAAVSAQLARLPSIDALGLVALGGDHLVAYPFLKRAIEAHPDLVIFHVDAHTDLRPEWEGEPFNHATVLRRALDLMGPEASLWSWGIRSGLKEEFELAKGDPRIRLLPNELVGGVDALEELRAAGRPVYFTIDVDGIDPADIPGTGTPEPVGLRYGDVERVLRAFSEDGGPRLLGADVVELAPALDPTGRSNVAVARLVRTLLLTLRRSRRA